MKRSDELFKQDQAAIAGVRRIAEENTFALQSISRVHPLLHSPSSEPGADLCFNSPVAVSWTSW